MLHSELPIYRTVTALQRVIIGGAAHVRRDVKPTLGKLLMEESIFASVLIRRANVAQAGPQRAAAIEAILEQLEIIQVAMRHGCDLALLPTGMYLESSQLLVEAGRQATGWRKASLAPAS